VHGSVRFVGWACRAKPVPHHVEVSVQQLTVPLLGMPTAGGRGEAV
jgi:hypothetical protein